MPLIFCLHGTKEHNERETRLSTQETSYHNTNNTRSIVPLPQSSFQLSQSVRQLFRLALSAAGKKQKNRDHPYFLYDTYTSKQCDYIHIAPAWRWWRGGWRGGQASRWVSKKAGCSINSLLLFNASRPRIHRGDKPTYPSSLRCRCRCCGSSLPSAYRRAAAHPRHPCGDSLVWSLTVGKAGSVP